MSEIFESLICRRGNFAGVFEYNNGTGYFYLCRVSDDQKTKILEAIHIISGTTDLKEADFRIAWNKSDEKVGLFIKGMLWAMFDSKRMLKLGGDYDPEKGAAVSRDIFDMA